MARPRKHLLLSPQKILLHLEELGRFQGESDAPVAMTQHGIADRIGIQRSHVPRPLKRLIAEGLVGERRAHVRGAGRSRQVYFLTWEGSQAASSIRAFLGETRVPVMTGGAVRRVKASEAPGMLGVRAGMLDIALVCERGPLTPEALGARASRQGLVECLDRAPTSRPFFGRQRELESLASWLSGGARLIAILGPSGIGKTSTAFRLVRRLRGTYHLLWLPVEEWDTLASFLRPLAAFLARTGRRRLAAAMEAGGRLEPAAVRQLLGEDFQDLAALMVIDDLQKASGEVATGMRILAESALGAPSGPRIVAISRLRRGLCSPRSLAGTAVRELWLQGLDRASASSILGKRTGPGDRDRILGATGGHPLYLEILSRRGPMEGMAAVWQHIQDQLVEGLGRTGLAILSAASVHRLAVDATALLSGRAAAGTIDGLVDRSLLYRTNSGKIGMHDMLRQYFYSRLSPGKRAALHRRAAGAILSEGTADGPVPDGEHLLEALRHLALSGERSRAAAMAARHGQTIVDAGMGASLLRDVLERLEPTDAGRHRGPISVLKAEILSSAGDRDGALREYRAVAARSGELSARAGLGIGSILEDKSDWTGAARAYSAAARAYPPAAAAAMRGSARIAWRRGKWKEASASLSRALRLARRAGDGRLAAAILADMGNIESDRGSPERSLELYGQAIRIDQGRNDLRELARVHNNVGAVLFYEDRWDAAMESYQRSLELAQRCGDVSTAAYAQSNIGQILARRGDRGRALKYLDASTGAFERLGDDFMVSSNLVAKGILHRVLEDWERSEDFFRRGIRMLSRLDMPRELAEARLEHGLALRDRGDLSGARRELGLALSKFIKLGARKENARAKKELRMLEKGIGNRVSGFGLRRSGDDKKS